MEYVKLLDLIFDPAIAKPLLLGISVGAVGGWTAAFYWFKKRLEDLKHAESRLVDKANELQRQCYEAQNNYDQEKFAHEQTKKKIHGGMTCGACGGPARLIERVGGGLGDFYRFACKNTECGATFSLNDRQFQDLTIKINSK